MINMCSGKQPTEQDVKKMQLEIDRLTIDQKIIKKDILRIFAVIRAIKKRMLIHRTNRLRKKAFFARVAELEAQTDVGYVKIEMIKLKRSHLQNQLENLLAVEPELILRREQLPPRASRGAPPLMLPPDPPRIAGR